jgi:hypothetical protein
MLVSIAPVVFAEMVAGSLSRHLFELTRTWNGPDPTLRLLFSRLQAEVASDYPGRSLVWRIYRYKTRRGTY